MVFIVFPKPKLWTGFGVWGGSREWSDREVKFDQSPAHLDFVAHVKQDPGYEQLCIFRFVGVLHLVEQQLMSHSCLELLPLAFTCLPSYRF